MFEAGRSVEDRPIEVRIIGDGPIVVLIMATIHGDEPAGTPLVQMLSDELLRRREWMLPRTAVLIANANPDGMAAGTRHNVRGVDLNRNFPAENWHDRRPAQGTEPLSEPESRALHAIIERYQPQRIISIHQPLACIDWDGPPSTEHLARRLSELCGLPVRKLGSRPGSLGAYAGDDLGIEVITIELPRDEHHLPDDELWQRYGPMLLQAVVYPRPLEPQ